MQLPLQRADELLSYSTQEINRRWFTNQMKLELNLPCVEKYEEFQTINIKLNLYFI